MHSLPSMTKDRFVLKNVSFAVILEANNSADFMDKTLRQYDLVVKRCKDIFTRKMRDYGLSWRVMRPSSITDQMFIKAQRISTLEDAGATAVGEGIEPEFIGLYNYAIMGLIQLTFLGSKLDDNEVLQQYQEWSDKTKKLMTQKNTDYGEAWRSMRVSSMTDLILMKIHRTKQIEDNQGKTEISEGIDANYQDIMNYSVFALILIEEAKKLTHD